MKLRLNPHLWEEAKEAGIDLEWLYLFISKFEIVGV
jgi:hypothetical protein